MPPASDPAHRRLVAQGLAGPPLAGAEEAVRLLLAVQSQDHGPATWSLAQRAPGVTEADVARLFDAGRIVRTHVLRPTWHFVAPDDLRTLLVATASRVQRANAGMYRQLGLDARQLARAADVVARALEGGHALTRPELGAALVEAGLDVGGQRLAYTVMHAELEGIVCSGPMRGKRHTYALLEERVPEGRPPDRDEALAELALRYVRGHGPATEKDVAAWASLTLAEVRAALGAAGAALVREEIDGVGYWSAEARADGPADAPPVRLLQGYDEFLTFADSRHVADRSGRGHAARLDRTRPVGVLLVDGQMAGHWRRRLGRTRVVIEVLPYDPLDARRRAALEDEAERHGAFLAREAEVTVVGP